jgi:protein-S-isoprenylcysteine O-methyltransferase Ste14
MRAFTFRFRVFLFVLLYVLGFLPPWDYSSGSRSTLWLAASTLLARSGWISLAPATLAVTLAALFCLVAGAGLRVWGTAYLGSGVMRDSALHGEGLVAAGPYRHLRNPLYLGSWLLALGTSILMPLDGAGFFLPAFSLFVLLLITIEERFLSAKLGNAYQDYRRLVPRWLPRITTGAGASEARPHWLQAVLAETYPIAFTLCFAALAWRYNARVLMQCLLICYGVSLVARAMIKRPAGEPVSEGTGL